MCFGICSKFTVAVGAWGPAAAEAIDSSQAADALHLMNDSGLLEDGVGAARPGSSLTFQH